MASNHILVNPTTSRPNLKRTSECLKENSVFTPIALAVILDCDEYINEILHFINDTWIPELLSPSMYPNTLFSDPVTFKCGCMTCSTPDLFHLTEVFYPFARNDVPHLGLYNGMIALALIFDLTKDKYEDLIAFLLNSLTKSPLREYAKQSSNMAMKIAILKQVMENEFEVDIMLSDSTCSSGPKRKIRTAGAMTRPKRRRRT